MVSSLAGCPFRCAIITPGLSTFNFLLKRRFLARGDNQGYHRSGPSQGTAVLRTAAKRTQRRVPHMERTAGLGHLSATEWERLQETLDRFEKAWDNVGS